MAGIRVVISAVALTSFAVAQQGVSFPTQDRADLCMYGQGDRGVVLAHGERFNKESWRKQATALATAGFRAMSIDFRGEGRSRGGIGGREPDEERRLDVLGAIHYLRNTGAKSVSGRLHAAY